MALARGTRLGPYQIESPIGAGGMGEVYKATDTRLERTVAIKVLPAHVASDPERKQRFERDSGNRPAKSNVAPGRGYIAMSTRTSWLMLLVGVTLLALPSKRAATDDTPV